MADLSATLIELDAGCGDRLVWGDMVDGFSAASAELCDDKVVWISTALAVDVNDC